MTNHNISLGIKQTINQPITGLYKTTLLQLYMVLDEELVSNIRSNQCFSCDLK